LQLITSAGLRWFWVIVRHVVSDMSGVIQGGSDE